MGKFIAKRLALGLLTVLAVAFLMFVFQQLAPEKPYAYLLKSIRTDNSADYAAQVSVLRARFGFDQPFFVQFLFFVRGLGHPAYSWFYTDDSVRTWLCNGSGTCDVTNGFQFRIPLPPDLGHSTILHSSVWDAISIRIAATAELMISSYIVTLLIAVPIGIVSAVRQYSRLDNFVTSASFIGISLPNYWFGTILIYLFAILPYENGLPRIFPAGGQHNPGVDSGLVDLAWHLVLPIIVLAVQSVAQYARFIRASMLEVLNLDYIRTARAKGLADRKVVLRHAFRNSLLPFITLMGLDIPQLFVGAVITEFIFSWPGMGQLFVNSAGTSDFPTLTGIALLLTAFVVIGNLLADMAYTWADPRIAYE